MNSITEHIRSFFIWWSKGLYKGLPDSLRKLVQVDQPKLILSVKPKGLIKIVWQQGDKRQERSHFFLHDKKNVDINELIPKQARKKKFYIDLQFPKKSVLSLQKPFPENVKDNLTQAIRYQIDRLTPFTSDSVYFDAVISKHDKKSKRILTNIFVAPRQLIEKTVADLKECGIEKVDIISVSDCDQPVSLTTDGIPKLALHSKTSLKPLYFMLALLVISLITPVIYKERRIDQLDTAIADLRKNASTQLAIRDKLYEAEEALAFLKEKRATSPMALDVVETLSAEIPKNTWLERLELNKNTLEIRGESKRALALIDLLEESPSFSSVSFNSPVSLNKKNGRDKFHIQATVEMPNG